MNKIYKLLLSITLCYILLTPLNGDREGINILNSSSRENTDLQSSNSHLTTRTEGVQKLNYPDEQKISTSCQYETSTGTCYSLSFEWRAMNSSYTDTPPRWDYDNPVILNVTFAVQSFGSGISKVFDVRLKYEINGGSLNDIVGDSSIELAQFEENSIGDAWSFVYVANLRSSQTEGSTYQWQYGVGLKEDTGGCFSIFCPIENRLVDAPNRLIGGSAPKITASQLQNTTIDSKMSTSLIFLATDNNPDTYEVKIGLETVCTGNWGSGNSVSCSINPSASGVQQITLKVSDLYGFYTEKAYNLLVKDLEAPEVFCSDPGIVEYQSPISISCNITDDSSIGSFSVSGSFSIPATPWSGNSFSFTLPDTLPSGDNQQIIINVSDGSAISTDTEIQISYHVRDRVSPTINCQGPVTIELGIGASVTCNIDDKSNSGSYSISGEFDIPTTTWSGNSLTFSIPNTLSASDNKQISISISDNSPHSSNTQSSFEFNVRDNTAPSVTCQDPGSIELGTNSETTITCTIIDKAISGEYSVTGAFSLPITSWSGDSFIINIPSTVPIGDNQQINISVNDSSTHSSNTQIFVTFSIKDSITPEVNCQTIGTLEFGENNTITCFINDASMFGSYFITGAFSIPSTQWSGNSFDFTIPDTLLPMDSYTIDINVDDGALNIIKVTTTFNLKDTNTPVVQCEAEKNIEVASNSVITCTITDASNSGSFSVSGAFSIPTTTWTENQFSFSVPNSLNVNDNLEITITVSDLSIDSVDSETAIIFNVQDTIAPSISSPSDKTFEINTPNSELSWTINDKSNGTYEIARNNSIFLQGAWNSGDQIKVTLDTTSPGNTEYTLTVTDQSFNSVSDTVSIQIIDSNRQPTTSIQSINNTTSSTSPVNLDIRTFLLSILSIGTIFIPLKLKNNKKKKR